MNLRKIEIRRNVDLKKYTSIKIGGRADCLFVVSTIRALRQVIKKTAFEFYVLGKGSNLLITDRVIKKPIVMLSESFTYIEQNDDNFKIGASTPLSFLIKYCLKNNLAGLENLVGIPATVGGLLVMSASSFGVNIASCLQEIEAINRKGELETLKKSNIVFGYRSSSLEDYVILGAKFRLSKQAALRQKIKDLLKKRLDSQDFDFPSCGSIFKNPKEFAAGFLIDSCGLKGLRKANAQVSNKHANFIINLGTAKYKDVDYLIQKIKDKVHKRYGIILQEEIKRWS
ncbi:MAG: UDP-N-acetylmuramate dehydrogenase [Omnitrophica bacterium]|nr:UDP-N-acetylmuramate dehydrogenase [Candidatus Omnitrophota bacterium]